MILSSFDFYCFKFSELPSWNFQRFLFTFFSAAILRFFWLQNAMLAFDSMKARSKNDCDWRISLRWDTENGSLGHFAHSQIAQALKDACFIGLWNAISFLFEFGMHWIKLVRQNQVWQVLTFNRVCRSAKNLTGKLWYMLFLLFNSEIQLSVKN